MQRAKHFWVFLFLLGCFNVGRAEPAAPVRVGIYSNAPKLFVDAKGEPSGILVDILREVASKENWKLEFVPCEWQVCLDLLARNRLDLLPDVAWTEERAQRFAFHRVPALHSWSQIYARQGNTIRSFPELNEVRIAVLADSVQAQYLTDALASYGSGARLVSAPSLARAFRMVEQGEADAAAVNHFFGTLHAARHRLEATPVTFLPARLFYAAPPGRQQARLDALDRHLAGWRGDPDSAYYAILQRWQARDAAALPPHLWSVLGAAALLLLTALGVANWLRKQVAVRTRELGENEQKLASILDSLDSLIYIKDRKARYQYVNGAMSRLLGRSADDIVGRDDLALFGPALAGGRHAGDRAVLAGQRRHVAEETLGARTYLTTKIPLRRGEEVYAVCGISTDITAHKQAEESLRIAATVFQSSEGMCVLGPDAIVLEANDAFGHLYGCAAAGLAGQPFPPFSFEQEGDDQRERMWNTVRAQGAWQGEVWTRRQDGCAFPAWLTVSAVRDAAGTLTNFVCTQSDISVRKQAEERIVQLAHFDPLTSLPNRRLLYERLQHSQERHRRSGQVGALLFLDMDNFKDLNDSRGHVAGDQLLLQVAARLGACARASDTVARLGGDEFVILLESVGASEEEAATHAETVGSKILRTMGEPFNVAGAAHHASCSIGITLCTGHEPQLDDLMRRGDLAMYEAKRQGRNTLRFFRPSMESEVTYRTAIEVELRDALRHGEFLLHYQGQVDHAGKLTGAEALVRWQHPRRGLVGPGGFIPVAEASGLILPLGNWVLRAACAQLAVWAASPATRQLTLAVNVSVRQFLQPDFVAQTLAIVHGSGADPRLLKLELTETLMIEGVEETIDKMRSLREHGIGFALDDFGTGYSSLSYLKRLPLDQLKIDQSFVRDVLDDPNDASIARSVVALGKSLGLGVIAEGVETEAQRVFLLEIGCDHWQGYLFSRPVEAGKLEELAAQDSPVV